MAPFDHEKLDVYRVSIEFVGWVASLAEDGKLQRNIRDQLLRASQSIPLNIAESTGKSSPKDRGRSIEVARGSAMESAAALDVMVAIGAVKPDRVLRGKEMLYRIVSMLSKMPSNLTQRFSEDIEVYGEESEYDRV